MLNTEGMTKVSRFSNAPPPPFAQLRPMLGALVGPPLPVQELQQNAPQGQLYRMHRDFVEITLPQGRSLTRH